MWNPVALETVERPHAFWSWLRREAPVWEVPGAGYYLVSRYADLLEISRDAETYSSELRAVVQRDGEGKPRLLTTQLVGQPQARVLGVADGEDHARHRRVVGRTFSPSRMERMSTLAREIAERCVASLRMERPVDVVESLAVPLPLELTIRLLGLPLEDAPRLQTWTDQALLASSGMATPEELEIAWAEIPRLQAHLAERLEEALARPREDVLGDLARAVQEGSDSGNGLARWEAEAVLFQLVVGGIETTVGLIGETIRHAVTQPDLWQGLRQGSVAATAVVEETLRLDGPATGNHRRTTRDTALAGVRLPEGSTLFLLWGSANRDEAQFEAPERFILDRPNIKTHLGFGLGKHFCLGASLARMEARVALQALVARAARVELAVGEETLRHKPSLSIRRLQSLPLSIVEASG